MSNQHFFICILCTIWECKDSNKKERTKAWFSSLASTNQQYRQTCTCSQDQPKRRLKKSLKTFISLGIHHYNISSRVIWLHFMQWSNGWKFVQFTVLKMLCNFERLKFVLVRDNIIRRHRPFNPCNRLTHPRMKRAECCYEWQELLIQRLTLTHFTGKHLWHCKSSMHIRLFLGPGHTNAVSNSEFFFLHCPQCGGLQVGRLPGNLKHLSYRNAINFCAVNQLPITV